MKMRVIVMMVALGLGVSGLALPDAAHAYSYAAAGKEPLIDGREAVLGAVAKADWAQAAAAVTPMKADLDYLGDHHDKTLPADLNAAIAAKDAKAVQAALVRAFAAEIERRLDGAGQNLNDYQTARILVVKAKRFFDAVASDLAADKRKTAEDGLVQALAAIGNPGVFGAGRRPADPAAFATARKATLSALGR